MTYDEFLRQLGKAGLTIREFAEAVKMNRNSVTNLAKQGEVPSHLAVIATLMGVLADHRIHFLEALTQIEIKPKKPRGGAAKGRFGGARQTDLALYTDAKNR
jgi:hypothetical protein